jgi:hypothetical protein
MTEQEEKPRKVYPRRKAKGPDPEPKRVHTVRHHALFRPPQGQDWAPEKFERIYVSRVRTDGELEEVPKWFHPEDLDDLGKLRDQFGGGVYELRAIRFDGTVYRIVRTNRLPGPAKPLYYIPDDEEGEEDSSPPAPALPAGGSEMPMMLPFIQIMMSESRAANERMMAMMQQNNQMMMQMSQHSTEVLVAALSGNKPDVAGMVTAIATAVKPDHVPAPLGPPVDPIEQAKKAIEFAKSVTHKEESIGEIVGAVAQGVGAFGMMQQMAQQNQPHPQPSPPPLPPANGSGVQG